MKTVLLGGEERTSGNKTIWVFTPSRTDPADLEFILVQRQQLLQDAVERVRESALTGHKHHLLFVGPRGCGKTHLITLVVSRLSADNELTDRLRIAWLNEDETCTNLLELLVKIQSALAKRHPAEFHEDMLDAAYELEPKAALEFVSQHLLATLGSRTLLVVVENLDAIFDGLGQVGQQQFRAFIQEHPKLTLVATAQRLVEDLSDRTSPFFGFFQTEHLKPLNVGEATELLQNIARLQEKSDVVAFLATNRGHSRVRALHHLSGGNHRIYIVLSQFITRDSIESLLGLFMKMVDELTPYYQERIRWLPPLQRKIVEFLCDCEGTVPVKEIAKRLFASAQTISNQMQNLREKGYVEANQRGRESLYEISEPLMRICVEVKDNQSHQPLRLLVDFLRVWYDDQDLKDRLGKMTPASASCAYLESAILRNGTEGNLRKQIILKNFQISMAEKGKPSERDDLLRKLKDQPEAIVLTITNWVEGNKTEAQKCIDAAIGEESNPSLKADLHFFRGQFYSALGDRQKSLEDYAAVIALLGAPAEIVAKALVNRGFARAQTGEMLVAIADYTAVIGLAGAPVEQVARALFGRGLAHEKTGETQLEIFDYTAVIKLAGAPVEIIAKALFNRGNIYRKAGATQLAIADYVTVIGLSGVPVEQTAQALINRGTIHGEKGEVQLAIADFTEVIGLTGASIEFVATALFNRGNAYVQAGEAQLAITDYAAAIVLSSAPVELVAKALYNRGITHGRVGEKQLAVTEYTTVIKFPGAPLDLVALALYARGLAFFQMSRTQDAQSDFEAVFCLPHAPAKTIVDSSLALSKLHFSDGNWIEGFQTLESGLERGAKLQPPYHKSAKDLIEVVFAAGLSPDGRREKVNSLLASYQKHQALPMLGEAVVQHIFQVFRAGEPFPSTDNLEGWALAWEQAAESVPEFRLSVRLLRTGIDFVKAGGKDPGILLDLTSPERSILEQALGLPAKEPARETR